MVQWLMLSSLIPSPMGEVKNFMTLSRQRSPFSPLVGEVHCKENSIYVFLFWELRASDPISALMCL